MVTCKIPVLRTVVGLLLGELSFPLVYVFTYINVHAWVSIPFKTKLCRCYLLVSSATRAFLCVGFAPQPSVTELVPQLAQDPVLLRSRACGPVTRQFRRRFFARRPPTTPQRMPLCRSPLPLWGAFCFRTTDHWLFPPPLEPKSTSLQPPPACPRVPVLPKQPWSPDPTTPQVGEPRRPPQVPTQLLLSMYRRGSPNSPPCLWDPRQPSGSDHSLVCGYDAGGGHGPPCGLTRGDQQASPLLSFL